MTPRALEHAALVSGDDDAREAGRAAAVQAHTREGKKRVLGIAVTISFVYQKKITKKLSVGQIIFFGTN
jgi:hypothetical protein